MILIPLDKKIVQVSYTVFVEGCMDCFESVYPTIAFSDFLPPIFFLNDNNNNYYYVYVLVIKIQVSGMSTAVYMWVLFYH